MLVRLGMSLDGRNRKYVHFHFRVGNLGQTATHAVLLAQLVTPDGVSRGLHSFIVPIRDRKTLRTFPGVIAGDMGAKASDINRKSSETFGFDMWLLLEWLERRG